MTAYLNSNIRSKLFGTPTAAENEIKPAGRYKIEFNGSNFATGVYFYRLEAGDFVQTKRMVLVK